MKKLSLLLLMGIATVYSCKKEQSAPLSEGKVYVDVPASGNQFFGPASIELNQKATLGRVLFYDKTLSINNSVACASCHRQEFAFADNVAFSRGFENRFTSRNSMPIQNIASGGFMVNPILPAGGGSFFWDGRETNLQNLVARPLTNHIEMGIDDLEKIPQKLAAYDYYKTLFTRAYGSDEITMDKIAECVSIFMTAITSSNTRFDQKMNGAYQFTALEAQGERLFNTKYECNNCHKLFFGAYTSADFMNIGLEKNNGDGGLGGITRNPEQKGMFKIPNLRNVAHTAPYMHDGRFASLDEVLDHYSSGIRDDQNLDVRLRDASGAPIKMNISPDERKAIIAFLNTLTDYQMLTDEKYSNPFRVR